MDNKYGNTLFGFRRKPYLKILEDMHIRAKELYGENVNLTERSPLGMFLETIAWEISNLWQEVENSHYNSFSLYADGSNLDDAVSNFGRNRFNGTNSTVEIKVDADIGTKIPRGFIGSTEDEVLFETLEDVTIEKADTLIEMESLEVGIKTNVYKNTITKIVNPVAGVRGITNPGPATGGSDIETDYILRVRNFEALREPTTGDNVSQYRIWAREINGVGNIKVLATTPTKGFVTIVITDIDGQPASENLINEVLDHINILRPVNAGVYVKSAINKQIDISFKVNLAEGYLIQNIQEKLKKTIEEYFTLIALKESYVSMAQIGKNILETQGVIDYSELKLNNKTSNIELNSTEVPTLQKLELELM